MPRKTDDASRAVCFQWQLRVMAILLIGWFAVPIIGAAITIWAKNNL